MLWRWLTGLSRNSDDALAWRLVLANLAPKILEALQEERWNTVLLSQSNSAAWLPFLPRSLARCVYFHDIRSDYLQRSTQQPARSNLRRIRHEERTILQDCDAAVFVSELDRARAEKLLQPPFPTGVAPICLDLDYFAFQPASINAAPVVLFTGHLSHPPNVDAVVYFLESIWPHVLAGMPEAQCEIVGLQPATAVNEAIGRTRQVTLIPNAPDIRRHFHSSRVYVVPMRYGGGVRQKILEAWAVGLPVVTSTMGAEGIAAQDGINCYIRDEPAAFANQVVSLLSNVVPSDLLQAARLLVEKQHASLQSSPQISAQIKAATHRRQQSPPRVLYDLRWLVPGKVGGVEQMTRELIDEIASFDRTFEYRFQGSEKLFLNWRLPNTLKHKVFCPDGPDGRQMSRRDGLVQLLANDLALPTLLTPELRALEWYTRLDFTVVHGLACLVHPDLRRFPSVVTMHDLQHLHRPEFFSSEDIATREREYRESCRLARHIICVSEFTRQDVHQRYGVPLDKMTTIWNLPPRLTGAPMTQTMIRRLLSGMGITEPFLYYPSQPWLHKNHRALLEAMRLVDRTLPANYKLVLTGQPFPVDHPAASLLLETGLRQRVVHLGYRSALEVAALYRTAEALIFPSLFEGFGMPLVEAMQQGCPIVCGQNSCLPEIVADSALFTDVTSPNSIAEAILNITRDSKLRSNLQKSGIQNLRRFNRRNLAEKTRAIYASVHNEHFA
jgi:glycosyltransferase involved in cell wall biosynthesis